MWKSKASVGLNTMVRLLSGVAVFVLLARYLGPESYSLLATAMAAGSVAALFTDYGLSIHVLRAAAMEPDRLRSIMRSALVLKVAFVGLSLLGAAILLAFLELEPSARFAVAIAFTAVLLASVADLCFVAPRAVGQFRRETTVVMWTSAVSLLIVGGTAALTRDLAVTSLAFGISRIVYLAAAWAVMAGLTRTQPRQAEPGEVAHMFRNSRGFALDGLLTNLSSQIDVLLVPLFLSAAEAGVYQAGARVVQVIAPLAMILGTVYIPRLASLKHSGDQEAFLVLCDRGTMEFFWLGVLLFGGFLFVLPPATELIFGSAYSALRDIWPYFAVSAMLRVVSAGAGVRLTAEGRPFARVVSQGSTIVFVTLLFFVFATGGTADTFAVIMAVGAAALVLAMSASVFVANAAAPFRFADYRYEVAALILGGVAMVLH